MKKSELKEIIKPMVLECIRESLYEDGILSKVIGEVVKGVQQPMITAERVEQTPRLKEHKKKDAAKELSEAKNKMLKAIGKDSYNGVNVFEGTAPMQSSDKSYGALKDSDPGDPGVDISKIFNSNWSKLV